MQILALKAYPQEPVGIREHPILRGFHKDTEYSKVRHDLKKNSGGTVMTIDKALEKTLHIEAVTRIEEEDNERGLIRLSKTEAQIGNTRGRCAKQSKKAVNFEGKHAAVISEIKHLKNARIVLNVGVQIISNEMVRV